MSEHMLQQHLKQLALFKLLEQVKAADLQLQHQSSLQKIEQLDQALAQTNTELERHQHFVSSHFCPELKRLQLNSMQRLEQETAYLTNEVSKESLQKAELLLAYTSSNFRAATLRDAAAPVAKSLRELKLERQDQLINELHYQRKYHSHG